MPYTQCPGVRLYLAYCLEALVDTNQDWTITVAELNAWIGGQQALGNSSCLGLGPVFYANINGSVIMSMCDLNNDGILTWDEDWIPSNACVQAYAAVRDLCNVCFACGWNGDVKRRRDEPHHHDRQEIEDGPGKGTPVR
jgi:hypothetical protein